MKTFTTILITVFCFWACSNHETSSVNNGNNLNLLADKDVNFVASDNKVYGTEEIKNNLDADINNQNVEVDVYQDDKLIKKIFLHTGLVVRVIGYNSQTNSKESEVEYFYKENKSYDYAEVKGKDGLKERDAEADKIEKDFQVQNQFLKTKRIEFPLAALFTNEVSDLSNILSVADNYVDFKTEIQSEGSRKVISFIDFNKNIRFSPSIITLFIPENTVVNTYELTLEGNNPSKEVFKTKIGELTREYFYKDGKIIKLVYRFANEENQIQTLEKRFEYHLSK